MPYVESYDRQKEIELLDKLAEQQVVITKCRRALAAARVRAKKAVAEADDIKREIFKLKFGEEALAVRQTNAKKAGVVHSAKAQQRKAALGGHYHIDPNAVENVRPENFEVGALTALPVFAPRALPTPSIAAMPEPIIVEPKAQEPERSTEPVDASGYASMGKRLCKRCHTEITRRGLCACPGVRHREFRVITKGPSVNIKHAPVPAYQMATKEGVA